MNHFKLLATKVVEPNKCPLFARMLMTHDGYMTTMLRAITNSSVDVKVLFEREKVNTQNSTMCKIQVEDPLERVVSLEGGGNKLLIGRSFWDKDSYGLLMTEREKGIGENMQRGKVEYRRQIIQTGISDIEVEGRVIKDMYSRSYLMFHQSKLVCQIQEYFQKELMDLGKEIN